MATFYLSRHKTYRYVTLLNMHKQFSPQRPSVRNSHPRDKRLSAKKIKRYMPWLAAFAIGGAVIFALISVILPMLNNPQPTPATQIEKLYFADSKYANIRSKFVRRSSEKEEVSIEYPVTRHEKINSLIAKAIDEIDQDFRQIVARHNAFITPMTENISYQVFRNDEDFFSIVVSIKQGNFGAHPVSSTRFWTFDKKTENAITLRDVMEQSSDDMKAVTDQAKKYVEKILAEKQQPATSTISEINEDSLQQFIAADKATINFPFGRGELLPASYGEITVSLQVSQLTKHLQHPLAKKLFEVPDLPKETPPAPQPAPAPPVGHSAACGGPCVALTFDDGPGAPTDRLLNILRERDAKATFFMLGSRVAAQPATAKRIAEAGHEVGNHSWSHSDLARLSPEQIRSEIQRTNDAIHSATGKKAIAMRPPYGSSNAAVKTEIANAGMAAVLWSVDTRDWADRNAGVICSRAVSNARSGAIILLHDIHATSVDAVPCIIDTLKKQGYRFVTTSTILGAYQPGYSYFSGV